MDRSALACLVVGAVLVLALGGCDSGGDGNGALKVAQAQVSAKEKALSEAQADVVATSKASAMPARPTSRRWTGTASSTGASPSASSGESTASQTP